MAFYTIVEANFERSLDNFKTISVPQNVLKNTLKPTKIGHVDSRYIQFSLVALHIVMCLVHPNRKH